MCGRPGPWSPVPACIRRRVSPAKLIRVIVCLARSASKAGQVVSRVVRVCRRALDVLHLAEGRIGDVAKLRSRHANRRLLGQPIGVVPRVCHAAVRRPSLAVAHRGQVGRVQQPVGSVVVRGVPHQRTVSGVREGFGGQVAVRIVSKYRGAQGPVLDGCHPTGCVEGASHRRRLSWIGHAGLLTFEVISVGATSGPFRDFA